MRLFLEFVTGDCHGTDQKLLTLCGNFRFPLWKEPGFAIGSNFCFGHVVRTFRGSYPLKMIYFYHQRQSNGNAVISYDINLPTAQLTDNQAQTRSIQLIHEKPTMKCDWAICLYAHPLTAPQTHSIYHKNKKHQGKYKISRSQFLYTRSTSIHFNQHLLCVVPPPSSTEREILRSRAWATTPQPILPCLLSTFSRIVSWCGSYLETNFLLTLRDDLF